MNKHLWISTIVLASSSLTFAWDGSTFDGSNWLVNGNAEVTGTGTKTGAEVGWAVNSGSHKIDVKDYTSLTSLAAADRPTGGGNNYFMGGDTNANDWYVQLYQQFSFYGNVPACAKIDKGDVAFTLSGYMGNIAQNYYAQTWTQLIGKFWLADGTVVYDKVVGGSGSGFQTSSNDVYFSGKTGFRYVEWTGVIPVNTRKIEIFVNLGKNGNGWDPTGQGNSFTTNFAAADNIQFNVGSAPVPEPMSMIALGLGAVGIVARRRRKQA